VRRPDALRNPSFDTWQGREDDLAADEAALRGYADAQRRRDFDTAVGQGAALLTAETSAAEVVARFTSPVDPLRRAGRPRVGRCPASTI
jgi:nitronate monooxygenase